MPLPGNQPLLLKIFGPPLLFFVVLGVWLTADLQREYEKVVADTSQRAMQRSLIISQAFRTKVLASDYVLRDVLGRIQERDLAYPDPDRDHAERMTKLLKEKAATVPDFFSMVMFNRDCVFTATATGKNTGVQSKQELCEARRLHRGPDVLASYVPGRKSASGKSVLTLSRHLTSPAGDFMGGVLGVSELNQAQKLFDLPGLDTGNSVALLDDDKVLLARHPLLPEAIEKPATTLVIPAELRSAELPASTAVQFDIDGRERIFGFSRIEGFPFMVAFGFDKTKALEAWQQRAVELTVGYFTLLLLAFLAARSHWIALHQREVLRASEAHFRLLSESLAERTAELDEQKQVFEKLVYESTDAVLISDGKRFINCNNAAVQMLGCDSKAQLLDLHPSQISPEFQPDGSSSATKANAMVDICLETGSHKFEWGHTRANGDPFWVEIALTKIQLNRNLIVHALLRDISETKALHSALIQEKEKAEQATRTKAEFLANMSHEIRTPMNAILGLTQLVLDTELQPQQRDYLKKSYTSSRALLGILNDILDYSKIEAGHLEIEKTPLRPEELLRDVADLFVAQIEEKGLELFLDLCPDLPAEILGDALRLSQVLNNLVGNAIKFTERGEIHVKVELAGQAGDELTLRFAVRDTGIGLSKEQADRLFQAFTQADGSITRRYGGTGLGLSISQKLVQLMGGEITVSGAPGQGATFSFTIRAGHSHGAALDLQQLGKLKVLVVDDQETSRQIIESLLTAWGLTPASVASGEAALAAIADADQSAAPFDAILLDWRMPGLSGLDVARRLDADATQGRLAHPLLVVMVTAYDKEQLLAEAGSIRLAGVVTKPVTPSYLLDTLINSRSRLLSRASTAAVHEPVMVLQRFEGARVLLVEDNAINQDVAAGFLRKRGIEVSVANHGKEAVAWVQKAPFDLILMDLHMPIMDGFAATQAIRALPAGHDMPIIAMTAAVLQEDRERCTAAGMVDFVAKPIDPDDLTRVLIKWLPARKADNRPLAAHATTAPPAAALPEIPGFDFSGALQRLDGNTALLTRLLEIFLAEQADTLAQLSDLLARGETTQACTLLHTLRGVAANLGLEMLVESTRQLEQACKAGQPKTQHEAFSTTLETTLQTLRTQILPSLRPATTATSGATVSAALAALLPALRAHLLEHELMPDTLMQSLLQIADGAPPASPLRELLAQIDRFDFVGALNSLEKLECHMGHPE